MMTTGALANGLTGYLTTDDVTKLFPAEHGKTMHVNTINAWITKGVKGIKLKAWKPGKRYYTTKEAVQEFLDATRDASESKTAMVVANARKSSARKRALNAAAKRHGMKLATAKK